MIIGITAPTHSKLEYVIDEYKKAGIPVFDADLYIKYLLLYHQPTKDNLSLEFNDSFTKLRSKKIINNGKLFKMCVKHIEDDVFTKFNEWKLTKNSNWVIFKSYILFEMGWDDMVDKTLLVYSDKNIRYGRRGKWQPGLPNLFYEYDPKVKKHKSDFVVDTNDTDSDINRRAHNYKVYFDSLSVSHLKNN